MVSLLHLPVDAAPHQCCMHQEPCVFDNVTRRNRHEKAATTGDTPVAAIIRNATCISDMITPIAKARRGKI